MEVCTEYRPIEERPSEDDFYLCRILHQPNQESYYQVLEWHEGDFWHNRLKLSSHGEFVTHWAPIPTVIDTEILKSVFFQARLNEGLSQEAAYVSYLVECCDEWFVSDLLEDDEGFDTLEGIFELLEKKLYVLEDKQMKKTSLAKFGAKRGK